MKPLISVLLVTYNAGPYLEPAVRSMAAQTYPNIELVLVDNGSTDSSCASIQGAARGRPLNLVRLAANRYHNGGLIAGLPHCAGEYIAIMDADDLSAPTRLARQLAALEADRSLAGTGSAATTIDPAGNETGREFTICDPAEIASYAAYDMPFIFPTLFCRREVFLDFPFHAQLPMAHDLDFLSRAVRKYRIGCLSEPLFQYRRHAHSTTSSKLAALFAHASVVRLANARRQAGRPANDAELLEEKNALVARAPLPHEVFTHYARRALAEGLHCQAAWHARKAGVFGNRLGGLGLLFRTVAAARTLPARERSLVLRLAALGTVGAYRLHPLAR